MFELGFSPVTNLKTQVSPQVWGRMKLSRLIELPEETFRHLVSQIEKNPFFQKLARPENPKEKIFGRRPFLNTDLSHRFYQINEETMPQSGASDVGQLLEKHKKIIPIIHNMGIDCFRQYFLADHEDFNVEQIAQKCQITPAEVKTIRELVDDCSIQDLINPRTETTSPELSLHYTKIAAIEKNEVPNSGDSELRIGYFSCFYARGRYSVNYNKLYQMKREGKFTEVEFKRIKRLIKQVELINTRQTILYQIISNIVQTHADYFKTGMEKDLKPLSGQDLAAKLGVHRSTVHRAAAGRSLETPWGEEKKLKFFLINQKSVNKIVFNNVLTTTECKLSDTAYQKILKDEFQITLARRTICTYRNELSKRSSTWTSIQH